jgi:beta-galactosidase
MDPITFDPQCYRVGGQPIYLLSGEFHYFRVPRADWRRRMQLFKQAGGNCLATYIPWLLHEPHEGEFRFGETADWLDLEGFLQAAGEAGLYVLARPGPYQYSELIYDGLPGWLCEGYPPLLARDRNGEVFRKSSVSYLHPLFLEKVRRWFAAVCPLLARYTIGRGGPLAFVQLDNELAGIHTWFGSLDYNPTTMGFGQPGGRYARFLSRRYESVEQLNQRYATTYPAFQDVEPPPPGGGQSSTELRRRKDYFDFYLGTIAEYLQALAGMVREYGLDTPLVHNSGNPEMNAYFLESVAAMGPAFLLGSDHYYNLGQNWPQNHPTPQYALRVFCSNEMLRLMGFPPTVLELPGGSPSDWPPFLPTDAQAAYLLNLAFGMKGSNYYVFTGGPNPPGAGSTTDLYDYNAAIGATGDIRPLYAVQQSFGKFLAEHAWFTSARRQFDVRFGLDLEQVRAAQYWKEGGDFILSDPAAWEFLCRGPLTTAFCAGLSPALCRLDEAGWVEDTQTPLVVAAGSSMAANQQEHLVRFLQNGGQLLIAPLLPVLDENLEPCTRLADFLGSPAISPGQAPVARPRFGELLNVYGSPYFTAHLPPEAEVVGYDEVSGQPIAWQRRTEGGGQVICLGLRWTHAMRAHERMLVTLLARLGLEPVLSCSNPNVWAVLWTGQEKAVLFLLNLFTAPQEAQISCHLEPHGPLVEAGRHTLGPVSVKTVDLDLG